MLNRKLRWEVAHSLIALARGEHIAAGLLTISLSSEDLSILTQGVGREVVESDLAALYEDQARRLGPDGRLPDLPVTVTLIPSEDVPRGWVRLHPGTGRTPAVGVHGIADRAPAPPQEMTPLGPDAIVTQPMPRDRRGMAGNTPRMIKATQLVLVVTPPDGRRTSKTTAFTVGRDSDDAGAEDIVVSHPRVSRQHVRFEPEEHHWTVSDLQSTNGTFVKTPEGWRRLKAPMQLNRDEPVLIGLGSSDNPDAIITVVVRIQEVDA